MRTQPATRIDTDVLLEFLFRLGQCYLACSEQTAEVERLLRDTATAYGARRVRVVAFPTAVFLAVDDGAGERVTLAEGPTQTLRLDQIAEIYRLGDAAQEGSVTPSEGLERLATILRQPPRFGPLGSVLGHTIQTVGLALVLMPTPVNLAAAMVLGLVIGVLKLLNQGRAVLAIPLPVVAATIVSALILLAEKNGIPVTPLYAAVPPIVTFLPGVMLTLGMKELAHGDMVSGSSRLITGFVQLVLLAFGLTFGALLVGEQRADLLYPVEAAAHPQWVAIVGVVVFAAGIYLHSSAPRRSFWWFLFVMLAALASQRLGAAAFGSLLSGFFGTLVATPLAYVIQERFKGPPATVTFLPAFWLLVPGSLGLQSVARMLGDRVGGLESLVSVVFVMASIALGTLVGMSLYEWVSERARRLTRLARG